MRLGSLFSGAGLGDIGWLMAGFDIRWQCEIDPYCQKILELRYPESKKYHDIKTLKGEKLEPVDIIVGGVPCQAASVAGKQRGREDDRWLWPEAIRIVKEVKPRWVVWENVFGLLSLERGVPFENICSEMESCGYEVQTFSFTAHSLGASHRRERIWIVGYAGCVGQKEHEKQTAGVKQSGADVADTGQQYGKGNAKELETNQAKRTASNIHATNTNQPGLPQSSQRQQRSIREKKRPSAGSEFSRNFAEGIWRDRREAESRICRVTDVRAGRVDRLKCLGNGQVVSCTAFIGQQIMEFEEMIHSTGAV